MRVSFSAVTASCILLIFVGMLSCQREDYPDIAKKNPSSKNVAELSAALKVWHGVRVMGTPPAPTGSTPVIDPAANPSVMAIAGRYAIIKPEVISGEIAGYYVAVPGSGQYFNVDYTKPRNVGGRNALTRRKIFLGESNADSSIVIVLPPNINVPDTFCVTYWPYDPLGNIGQPVTTCIYVSALGAPPNQGWLQNDFRLTASWELDNGNRVAIDTIIFNRFVEDSNMAYACDFTVNPPALFRAPGFGTTLVNDSIKYHKNNLRFATNGAFDYKDFEEERNLNLALSTCTQFVFDPNTFYMDSVIGGYNYNPTTQRMILIFEFDSQGYADPEYWEYQVIKINDNHFILRDLIDDYFIRFER